MFGVGEEVKHPDTALLTTVKSIPNSGGAQTSFEGQGSKCPLFCAAMIYNETVTAHINLGAILCRSDI